MKECLDLFNVLPLHGRVLRNVSFSIVSVILFVMLVQKHHLKGLSPFFRSELSRQFYRREARLDSG